MYIILIISEEYAKNPKNILSIFTLSISYNLKIIK